MNQESFSLSLDSGLSSRQDNSELKDNPFKQFNINWTPPKTIYTKTPRKNKPRDPSKKRSSTSKKIEGDKTHQIKKQEKDGPTIKKVRRMKDVLLQIGTGRPTNQQVQKYHLIQSKSYNDIIYHFARLMIFIRQKQKQQNFIPTEEFTFEREFINKIKQIMSMSNFPSFNQDRPVFLLHPNSVHFVIKHLKETQDVIEFSQQKMKLILFAFLDKRRMLSNMIYNYICQYWSDIVYLINHSQQINNQYLEKDPVDQVLDGEEMDMKQEDQDQQKEVIKQKKAKSMKKDKKVKKQKEEDGDKKQKQQHKGVKKEKDEKVQSQIFVLRRQLQQDQSIIAYEIACYLHACCIKFGITIREAHQ